MNMKNNYVVIYGKNNKWIEPKNQAMIFTLSQEENLIKFFKDFELIELRSFQTSKHAQVFMEALQKKYEEEN